MFLIGRTNMLLSSVTWAKEDFLLRPVLFGTGLHLK